MEPYAITIERQFAAMGHYVADRLSENLGIKFYDRALVEEVSNRLNLDLGLISGTEETAGKSFLPLGMGHSLQDDIYYTQRSIIQDLASRESCIIVGRLSNSALKNHPRHLSIYLYAPHESRLKNCVEHMGMDVETGKKMIHKIDIARGKYRKKYAPQEKEIFTNGKIMLDTSFFGLDGTAKIITDIAKERFL